LRKYALKELQSWKRNVTNDLGPSNSRRYFYDGLKVVAEGTGQSDKTYYTLGPGAIGGIICRDENGTKYWYHYDRLGNVVGVTNAYGSVASLYTMDAFGNVLEKGNGGYLYEHTTDPQPYHLTTKEYDPDSRLYYFHARWYDPETGRFISRDPLSNPGGERVLTPYTYCLNNPLRLVDPSGRAFDCPSGEWPTLSEGGGGWQFFLGAEWGGFTAWCHDEDIECKCDYFCVVGGAGSGVGASFFSGGRFHGCYKSTDLSGHWVGVMGQAGVVVGGGLEGLWKPLTGMRFWGMGARIGVGGKASASGTWCIIDCKCTCRGQKEEHGPTTPTGRV